MFLSPSAFAVLSGTTPLLPSNLLLLLLILPPLLIYCRFEPEISDPANAGLGIVRDMLLQVSKKHPQVSLADLWTLAGALAIEWMGGPAIPFRFGRTDDASGARCPAHGRLPDASQGAAHLRAVFGRMGFGDGEIVALSGAHTVGRCHASRSGFDVRDRVSGGRVLGLTCVIVCPVGGYWVGMRDRVSGGRVLV